MGLVRRVLPDQEAVVKDALALADEMREVRTICHCGKKATMVVRRAADGKAMTEGEQVQIGGNETYVSLCRRHWREAVGDRPAA